MSDLIHCQIDCKLFWYNSHQLLKKKVKIIFVCRSNSALPIPGCYHYWLLLWAKKLNLLKFFLSTLHLCRCDYIQILLSSLHFHNGVQTLITPHGWYHCCFVTGNWIQGALYPWGQTGGKVISAWSWLSSSFVWGNGTSSTCCYLMHMRLLITFFLYLKVSGAQWQG